MSITSSPRSSATVNANIRALVARARGVMTATEAARYQELLDEWEEAVRREQGLAA